jgi:hypothetical protein
MWALVNCAEHYVYQYVRGRREAGKRRHYEERSDAAITKS